MVFAVVAVAATARKEFPTGRDRESFEAFARRIRPYRLSIYYRGQLRPIEQILYKWIRCVLVHEADWPVDIEFVPDPAPGLSTVRAAGLSEDVLQISESWFHDLIFLVRKAAVNYDDFKDSANVASPTTKSSPPQVP